MAEIIREGRAKAALSQRDLARAAGLTQANVNKIEHNQTDARLSTIRRLLDRLGYELVAIPKESLPLLRDLLHPDEDAPFIDIANGDA